MRSHGMFRWPEGLRATFRRFHNYLHVNGKLGKEKAVHGLPLAHEQKIPIVGRFWRHQSALNWR